MTDKTATIPELIQRFKAERRLSTVGMDELTWLAVRNCGIGASESYAAAGLCDYRQALDIVKRKLSPALPDDNDRYVSAQKKQMGHVMEPITAERFMHHTGLVGCVQNLHAMLMHKQHDCMIANLDRRIVGLSDEQRAWVDSVMGVETSGPGVCELKNVEWAREWGKPDNVKVTGGLCTSGEIPESYFNQVQHQMAVSGYGWGFLVVTIGGWETRFYPIVRDDDYIADLVDICIDTWGYVERNELPPIDHRHKNVLDLLKRLHPGTDGSVIDLAHLNHWRQVESDSKAKIKEYQAAADAARAHILSAMGDAAVAFFDDDTTLRRTVQQRKGYTVEPSETVDVRYAKPRKADNEARELLTATDENEQKTEE